MKKHSIGGVSSKFKKACVWYKHFASGWDGLDWSNPAMIDAYNAESFGTFSSADLLKSRNGFYIGKQWMGVTIDMWREDIARGHLSRLELSKEYPTEFLDRVLR